MRILVTGGSGFIGSAFLRAAAEAGHELLCLVRPKTDAKRLLSHPLVHWIEGELQAAPWVDIARFAPEAVMHSAWIATPGVYLESAENDMLVAQSIEFFRRARDVGVSRFVGVGTCIEYRIDGHPLREGHSIVEPQTRYARAKVALQQRVEEECRSSDCQFCWGRVFYPFGVGEHPDRVSSALIRKISRGEKITLKTPNSTKDYIYIDDLAKAMLATVERDIEGPINWGTGNGVTIQSIADDVGRLLGRTDCVITPESPPFDPLDYVVADARRLRDLGWRPIVPIAEGLRRLAEDLLGKSVAPLKLNEELI